MKINEFVKEYTAKKIHHLESISDTGEGKALLAKLRQGIGKEPGEIPALWGTFLESIPDELIGPDGKPSRFEEAVYNALTLYAMHKQGSAGKGNQVNVPKTSMGTAVGTLVLLEGKDSQDRIQKKLEYPLRSNTIQDAAIRLRSLIQLLKVQGIGLDYSQLASDLYFFANEGTRKSVQLQWGRDFYKVLNTRKVENDDEKKS